MIDSGKKKFDFLMQQHVFKMVTTTSIEVCSLALVEIVGHVNILSAARMNNGAIMFLCTTETANKMVDKGVVTDGILVNVLPLATPSMKIIFLNFPPFIKDCHGLKFHRCWLDPISRLMCTRVERKKIFQS